MPERPQRQDRSINDGRSWPYGFGLALQTFEGRPKIMHSGSVSGFHAALARYPEDDLTIAIMTNLGRARIMRVLERHIARRLLGAEPPAVRDLPLSEEEKARCAGSYDAGSLWFDVVPEGDRLALVMHDPDYVEEGETYFRNTLAFQGGGVFVAESEPDLLELSCEPGPGSAAEIVVRWDGVPSQAVRRSPD